MDFALDSLSCASPQRNRMLASSRDTGWHALLLDHLEGIGEVDAYDKPVTPDFCVTLGVHGSFETFVRRNGQWRSQIYRPGAIGLTAAGIGHRLRWKGLGARQTFSTINLYLPARLVEEAIDHGRRIGRSVRLETGPVLPLDDRMVTVTALSLLRAVRAGGDDLYADSAARWLAVHLVEVHGGRPSPMGSDTPLVPDARLERAIDFMIANFARRLTISELAAEASISPFHFTRVFRRATGRTVHDFLTEQRMQAARRHLAQSDLRIDEVARACGYSRSTAFSTAFSRHAGCSPSLFRKSTRHR